MKKKGDSEQIPLQGTEEEEMLIRLSDRVERAIAMIQQLRKENATIRQRAEKLEADLREKENSADRLREAEEENARFHSERSEVRGRIERMLSDLEGLDEG